MRTPRLPLLALTAVLAGAGCATVPPPTLYVLKATDPAPSPVPAPLVVALGPVTVPDYLDRTDIVHRASDNRLAVADNERWAESLRAGLQRVLAADLARRLGATVWVTSGSERAGPADLEVPVDLETFEPDATGRVVLTASWEVRRPGLRSLHDRSRHIGTAPVTGTEDQVRIMSEQVDELAADLAITISAARARKE
jgi:hypothetical protein